MKKFLFAATLLLSGLVAFSCSSDKDNYRVTSDDIDGVYLGTMDVDVTGGAVGSGKVNQKVYISKVSGENDKMKLEIKDFGFSGLDLGTITTAEVEVFKAGDDFLFNGTDQITLVVGKCDLDLSGSISPKGVMAMKIGVSVPEALIEVDVDFKGDRLDEDLSSEAKLISFDFDSENVLYSEIQGDKVVFYAVEDLEDKTFSPIIEVSEGATISPASGAPKDFSKVVTYTVTSEDGIKTYSFTVEQAGDVTLNGFEQWYEIENNGDPYFEPYGWATSNIAINTIKSMIKTYEGGFPVNPTEDSRNGIYAAKIETLDTKGLNLGIPSLSIPKVTAGTLFLGSFKVEFDRLLSTKFGVPYLKKPISVKGFYKYIPGEEFYNNYTPNTEGQDACAMTAVLYEVEDYDSETLTGKDLTTSDKIVAIAQFTSYETVTEYTEFELVLDYGDNVVDFENKKYKFTVVFSTSAQGTEYYGALGSALWIDDVEIINE